MTELQSFEADLAALIGEATNLRPFVCDGNPLLCDVFIVGANPASEMATGFWDFWDTATGFNKAQWFETYLADRASRPLKPGRIRRNAVSASRRTLEWVTAGLAPIRSLETNVFSLPTEALCELRLADRRTTAFDFLLERVRPTVLVVHGRDAINHIRNKMVNATVIAVPHFSRGWSQNRALELGANVRAQVEAVRRR